METDSDYFWTTNPFINTISNINVIKRNKIKWKILYIIIQYGNMIFNFIIKTEFPVRSYSNVLEFLTIYIRISEGFHAWEWYNSIGLMCLEWEIGNLKTRTL